MSKRLLLAAILMLLAYGNSAKGAGGHCIPPFGYIETCGARCGAPGTCSMTEPNAYCLVTAEGGYGCFDGTDDPCCKAPLGF